MKQYTGLSRKQVLKRPDAKLAQQAYEYLQQKLWSGALVAGAKLSEARLADELGMSRTPIREAIRRLEREGIVRQIASSGTFIKQPDRVAIVEAFEMRMAVECFAVQKAARRMKPAHARELKACCDRMLAAIRAFRDSGAPLMDGTELSRYLEADLHFHMLLIQAAANRRMLETFCDVNLLSCIFGCRSHARDLHHVAWVWLQHARVARAVGQRDPQAALRALEQHMQASMTAALDAYDDRLGGRASAATVPVAVYPPLTALMTQLHRHSPTATAPRH